MITVAPEFELPYSPPAWLLNITSAPLESGTLTLDDPDFRLDSRSMRHLCSNSDTHIAVVIDFQHSLPDTNFDNNILAIPFTLMTSTTACISMYQYYIMLYNA